MDPNRHPPSKAIERSDYESESEGSLRIALEALWPLKAVVRLFVRHLGEPWLNGKITGQGIQVGPRQMPSLHRLSCHAAAVLGVRPPDLFVVRSTNLETVLLGVGDQNSLAIPAELLEIVDDEGLLFLLGREMGHIRSEAVLNLTVLRWIKEGLGSAWKSLGFPVMLALHAWKREATFAADRAGLLVCQDLEKSGRTLLRLVLGRTAHLESIDLERYTRSGLREILRHPLKCAPELLEPEPFLPRRIAELYAYRASPRFRALYPDLGA